MRRRDCRFALQLWADGPDIKEIPVKNMRANRRCPSPGVAQSAYDPPKPFNVTGATRIVQRIICVGSAKRNWCSARGRNYVRTYQVWVDLVDYIPPVVQILQDTPLATGAWVSDTQPLNYTGHPALAVPVGKSSAGLPASMQLIGRCFDDPLLLRVAYAYQHSVDWDATIAITP